MPFEKSFDVPPPVTAAACSHLRSKAMYVTGSLKNPHHPDEVGAQYCWCNLTQHIVGPDNQHVNPGACVAGRGCFRESV